MLIEALEVFIHQQQEADPNYFPPLRDLLRAATEWDAACFDWTGHEFT
jgi:hypothetical protein